MEDLVFWGFRVSEFDSQNSETRKKWIQYNGTKFQKINVKS